MTAASLNPSVFREYDIRGVADRDLSDRFAFDLGRAFGTHLAAHGAVSVAVGRDCRLHSRRLRDALVRGLNSAGLDVIDIGVVPTPVLYWAVHRLGVHGGIQITGSHNPAEDNGFKMLRGDGPVYGDEIQSLRRRMQCADFFEAPAPGCVREVSVVEDYLDELSWRLHPGERGVHVVVDAGNGTGGLIAGPLLRRLGFEVTELYCEMDGRFPNHHPDPTVEENLADLRREVLARGAELGVALDGDADRIGVVDARGRVVWGDQLMILFARSILREQPGATFIAEVKCSTTLFDEIERAGGRAIMWKVGHSLIKTKMRAEGAALAGEMSGHMFFAHRYLGYDDAVYAAGRLCELLSWSKASLAELVDTLPITFNTPELRLEVSDDRKFEVVRRAAARLGARYEVIDIDGARAQMPGGWALVRASNTQPSLVLRFEASTADRLSEIRDDVMGLLREILDEMEDKSVAESCEEPLGVQPVIMAGGSGTRLWPLSRVGFPKQFLALEGSSTLLQLAARRLAALSEPGLRVAASIVVGNEDHRFLIRDQLAEAGLGPAAILLEPAGRNTAPAVTLAALQARAQGADPVLVVTPADQTVTDEAAFVEALRRAAREAADGAIVFLGVTPDHPATGFGYIAAGAPVSEHAVSVDRFVEKPDATRAARMLEAGGHYWNSGIFVMRASTWLAELAAFRPDIASATALSYERRRTEGESVWPDREAFLAVPAESVDYAVMERAAALNVDLRMVPLSAGWSDLGAWDAVWQAAPRDDAGNATTGDAMVVDSHDTLVMATSRLVSVIGLEGVVVVETPDAVLVADRTRSQDVRAIVRSLGSGQRDELQQHRKVARPWGWYDSIDSGDKFQVKRINIKPGASLSLQKHYHRAEHWVVVSGVAEVTCGAQVLRLTPNQSVFIPLGEVHRLANPGPDPLEIIEVQCGVYLGEDDIVRLQDVYGRGETAPQSDVVAQPPIS